MPDQGPQGEIIMMGKKEKVPGWKGQLFVAIVKLKDGNSLKFQVVCDSSDPADVEFLPETKSFENKMEALNNAMEMERSKAKWKQLKG
jgi:hypothetical protein